MPVEFCSIKSAYVINFPPFSNILDAAAFEIEKWATKGNINFFNLPHPMEKKNTLNFSFSGIKTAVNLIVKKNKKINQVFKRNMAASFQNKIVEILEKKLLLSLNFIEKKNFNLNSISIVGGVACNKEIKKSFLKIAKKNKCKLVLPPKYMFSDNAAMIGWACLQKNKYSMVCITMGCGFCKIFISI